MNKCLQEQKKSFKIICLIWGLKADQQYSVTCQSYLGHIYSNFFDSWIIGNVLTTPPDSPLHSNVHTHILVIIHLRWLLIHTAQCPFPLIHEPNKGSVENKWAAQLHSSCTFTKTCHVSKLGVINILPHRSSEDMRISWALTHTHMYKHTWRGT